MLLNALLLDFSQAPTVNSWTMKLKTSSYIIAAVGTKPSISIFYIFQFHLTIKTNKQTNKQKKPVALYIVCKFNDEWTK